MTMTKAVSHTPGPWVADGIHISADKHGGRVAKALRVFDPSNGSIWTQERVEANARLIAAAPKLLAALIEGRAQMQLRLDALGAVRSATWLRLHEAIVAADAAIAEATSA